MPATKKTSLTLFIGGMTCAACVRHVEGALKSVPGVGEVTVNLATGKAAVEYDPSQATLADLKKAVEDMGYSAALDVADIQITGMSCAACVKNIERVVGAMPGVNSRRHQSGRRRREDRVRPGRYPPRRDHRRDQGPGIRRHRKGGRAGRPRPGAGSPRQARSSGRGATSSSPGRWDSW